MTKEELIQAIRQSPLTEQDFQDILSALIETMMGQAFVGLGMDMVGGQPSGRWVPAPDCKLVHTGEPGYGWRGFSRKHEHWVE